MIKEKFAFIDALRGWAALGVVLVHSMILSHQKGFLFLLGASGQRGVQLFYCVSAFTLCYSFDRRLEPGLRNYFIRRFFRIAPLYYAAIAANVLLNSVDPPSGVDVLTGMFFVDGFSAATIGRAAPNGWSIAVETSFYLVLPLILLFVKNTIRALFFTMVMVFTMQRLSYVCFLAFDDPVLVDYFFFLWFPIELPVFCLGLIAFFFWKKYCIGVSRPRLVSALLLLASLGIMVITFPITNAKLYPGSAAFIPLILGLSLYSWKIFVNPVTVFLGKISYSIYLVHGFFLMLLGFVTLPGAGTLWGMLLAMALILAGTLPVSLLTYHLIEKPGMDLGRVLIERLRSREDRVGRGAQR